MALVINSNLASLNAQRQLSSSQNSLNTSMERLASGQRINSAGDDAAGLAISNRMASQTRGLGQAIRNANDGISLIQTAEGALGESTNILQRMRELSIQSANGTYSSEDRLSLQAEVEQLKSELNRVAETTSFNGHKVLDGSLGEVGLQVGSEANETIGLNMGAGFDAASLGAEKGVLSKGNYTLTAIAPLGSQKGVSGSLDVLEAGDLIINGVDIPIPKTGFDTLSTSDSATSAIAMAAAINSVSDQTNVTANAATFFYMDIGAFSGFSNGSIAEGDLVINGVPIGAFSTNGGTSNIDEDSQLFVNQVNALLPETGVAASYNPSSQKITFDGFDGRNIQLELSDDAYEMATLLETGVGSDITYKGTVILESSQSIDITGNAPEIAGLGAVADDTFSVEALQPSIRNAATVRLGVTANSTNPMSTTGNDLVINGQPIVYMGGDLDDGQDQADATSRAELAQAINKFADTTGVSAFDDGNKVVLTAAAGVDIRVQTDGASSGTDIINYSGDGGGWGDILTYELDKITEGSSPFFAVEDNGWLSINGMTVDFESATANVNVDNDRSALGRGASAQFTAMAINSTETLKDQVMATAYTEANLGKVLASEAEDGFSLAINGYIIDIDNAIEEGDANGNLAGTLNAAFAEASRLAAADEGDTLAGVQVDQFMIDNAKAAAGLKAAVNEAGELLITAQDGRNITIAVGATANTDALLSGFDVTEANAVSAKGTVELEARQGYRVEEIGGWSPATAGILSNSDTVADIDITTAIGAQDALGVLDRAVDSIGAARGDLGAVNNRLDFTISNLSNLVENTNAAKSRILDADFAKETANLSRSQVLQQASQAMLAQANARPQQVLSLLQ